MPRIISTLWIYKQFKKRLEIHVVYKEGSFTTCVYCMCSTPSNPDVDAFIASLIANFTISAIHQQHTITTESHQCLINTTKFQVSSFLCVYICTCLCAYLGTVWIIQILATSTILFRENCFTKYSSSFNQSTTQESKSPTFSFSLTSDVGTTFWL